MRLRKLGYLTQAQVKVRNMTESRYILEYRFTWEDGGGFQVPGQTVWHRMSLTPNQTATLQSLGKDQDAENIEFIVRFPSDMTTRLPELPPPPTTQ